MRLLFVAKQKKNVDTFETTIEELLRRGHELTLAIQQRDVERDRRLVERFAGQRFSLVACPEERGDSWRHTVPLLRSLRDWAHYFQPAYARAGKLRHRALMRLWREIGGTAALDDGAWTPAPGGAARIRDALERIEQAIPSDPLHEEFIARHRPDALLVSPGLHFGSGQSDFIKSARALGIPVWMLLFSWDNLSTKGALHVPPDRMFVWNERQVREAADLHGFPREQVTVVGAPRFDDFFALHSVVGRTAFLAPLGLDPARRTVLYLCSSRFIASDEPAFIREWLAALRTSEADVVRECNVMIRPHPDVPLEPAGGSAQAITWREIPQATAWIHRPFGDPRAVVVRTTYSTPQAFYECLHHADAVVALNTSAELEAGIAGRPVLTVLATGEAANGQAHTLHFDYLLQEQGGFVRYAADLAAHERHLTEVLAADQSDRIRRFVMEFLRPGGDRPVAPQLADALVHAAAAVPPAAAVHAAGAASPPTPEGTVEGLRIEDLPPSTALAAKQLSVDGAPGVGILATPETRRHRQRGVLGLDPVVARWLADAVAPGDVLYDIGAGVGANALVAAVQRGALVIAFEPGFAVYRTLCENVRLNGATHSVVPLPIALTDRAGFFELEFSGTAGGDRHVLRNREWRARRDAQDGRQGHPVCAERLDDVVARFGIAPPQAIRISATRGADRILAGAPQVLSNAVLRSVLVTLPRREEMAGVSAAARDAGFQSEDMGGSDDFGFSLRLERIGARQGPSVWQRWRAAKRTP